MKKLSSLLLLAVVFSFSRESAVHAQGSAFTYQGRLIDQGARANGIYDFRFTLYDAEAGGTAIGSSRNYGTAVSNGLFTLTLDFGDEPFTGPARWLEMGERTNGNGSFTTLFPRQALTATPYAIMANSASNLLGTLPAAQISGSLPATQLSGVISVEQLPAGVLMNNATGVTLSGAFSGSGAGLTGLEPGSVAGTFSPAQIPNLDASKITTGVLASSQIPSLNASQITTGVFTGNGAGLTKVPGAFLWQVVAGNVQAASNNGYIATNNNAQTVVTLPASPNVGDIVRVSGSGLGGWKIAQNSGQTVLAGNLTGSFGVNWTAQNSGSRFWSSIASSADGTKLVASTRSAQLYTSSDSGVIWTARHISQNWDGVASSADGTKLVAVSNPGQIYTSTDSGVIWTAQHNRRNWYGVASSADGTKLVAVSDDVLRPGAGVIYTSTDSGVAWTARGPILPWRSVTSSADGTKLVAAANYGQIYTSADSGVSWMARNSNRAWQCLASSADGTRLVAGVWYGQIYISTDSGVTWSPRASTEYWAGVASSADGNKLVGVVYGGQVYTSTDFGATWTARASRQDWWCVASSADGTKLVAGNYNAPIYTSSLTVVSNTTVSTGSLVGAQYSDVELQYAGNGLFMVLSRLGTIYSF